MKKILLILALMTNVFAQTDHDVLKRLLDDKDTKFAFFITEYEGKNGEYYAKLYEKNNNNWHLEKHLKNLKGEADLQVGVMGLIDDAVSNIKSKKNTSKKSDSTKKVKTTTTKDKSEKKQKNKKDSDKTKIKKKKEETTSKKTGSTKKKKTTTKKESKPKNVEKKPTKEKKEKKKKNKTSKDSK